MIVAWILLGIVAFLVVFSFRVIGPTEMAVIVRLGSPVGVVGSGPLFRLRGLYRIVLYPTQQYSLDFHSQEVITKRDPYKQWVKEGEGSWEEPMPRDRDELETYEAAVIQVDTTVYMRWPKPGEFRLDSQGQSTGEPALIAAYRSAPSPDVADVLTEFFNDAVVSRVRAVIGEITWRAAIENRDWIRDNVTKRLLKEEGSPFFEAAITNVSLVMEEIQLPRELERALTVPQEELLKKRGISAQAEGEKELILLQGQGYAALGDLGKMFAPFLALADRVFGNRRRVPGEKGNS